MESLVKLVIVLVSFSSCFLHDSSSADSRAPVLLGEPTLSFCGISYDDAVDDPAGSTTKTRSIPLVCRSTASSRSPDHPSSDDNNYCKLVWQTRKHASMANSHRFQPPCPLQEASANTMRPRNPSSPPPPQTKLTDFWRSEADFCTSCGFGGDRAPSQPYFTGHGVASDVTRSLQPWRPSPQLLCVERIGGGNYLAMAAHPDGSGRVFLSRQDGKIWLASVPEHASGGTLGLDGDYESISPFLDISDRVHFEEGLGLMGVAFHPEFATNGRFFVSYNCDSVRSPTCGAGRCDDPSKLGAAAANGPRPCRFQLVVSEFSVNRGVSKAMASAEPSEVRRIFTMGLPHQPHTSYEHGGQILFGPSDGYLYLITGHGGEKADSFDFSQDKRSFLGKIVRLDINHVPGQSEISNRSTPMMKPEIFAVGLSNPRGCSFDSNWPSNLYCADVAKELYEEVHLISKGGNYNGSSVKADSPIIIAHGRPAAGRPPSIIGGLVYRGSTDPSLEGRYLYMYGSAMWAAMEASKGRGRYASVRIPLTKCSGSSPIPCRGGAIPGRVLSFGEDNGKDAFILATGGVYRVVRPGLCGGYGGSSPTGKPAVAGATGGSTDGGLLPAEPSPAPWMTLWTTGLAYVPFVCIAMYVAWKAYWKEMPNGQTNNTAYSCCNTIMCCVTNNWGMLNRS